MKEEQPLEIKWESESQKKKQRCESKYTVRPGPLCQMVVVFVSERPAGLVHGHS